MHLAHIRLIILPQKLRRKNLIPRLFLAGVVYRSRLTAHQDDVGQRPVFQGELREADAFPGVNRVERNQFR